MPRHIRARAVSEPVSNILSRSEMAYSGVPEKEQTHLRNYARRAFPFEYWAEDDVLRRQRLLWPLLEAYGRQVAKQNRQRGEPILAGIAAAKKEWEKAARRLEAKQVRRLPKLPDPMKTGAVPVVDADEDDPPSPREARPKRTLEERAALRRKPEAARVKEAHQHEKATEGEERWDPKWGDPDALDEAMPAPLPQGMRRLPQSEPIPIPEKPQRKHLSGAQKRARARARAAGAVQPKPPAA